MILMMITSLTPLEGRAAFLVTGDQHVLSLGEYEGVRIVTPAGFLKILGEP